MRFWVDKEQEKKPDGEWKDAYVFSINRKQYSTIFTNITNSWYRMDQMQIPAIYEDLFIIGLSIFALDKRVSRRRFKNCWTRDINVSIPVLEYDKWKDTGLQWEKMLGFLTGDHWHIVFRKSEVIYSYREHATNPMVEVFKNRIEFSNAGAPLVAIERIVDSVPVSRNENIAGFMHKCGICEERGSGYDKIVEATGKNELLAPRIENQNNQFTKAILFAKVPFELTTKEDRMRTCYMQACLAYVNFEGISNSDIRKIFGLGEKEKAKASRLLTSAVEGGYIKVMDPDTAPRYKKYIPYWA